MVVGFLGINSKSVALSTFFEKSGHTCFFHDDNDDLVFNLNQRIFLGGDSDLQINLVDRKNLSGSTDVTEVINKSEVIFSFIDCELLTNGFINVTPILDTIQKFYLSSHLDVSLYGKSFILSSVVNVGDCKKFYEKISQFGINFGYLPQFLSEKFKYGELHKINHLILGTLSPELSSTILDLFKSIREKNIKINVMSFESAEITKLTSKTLELNKIVISNLMGDILTSMGLEKEIPIVLDSLYTYDVNDTPKKYNLGFGSYNETRELKVISEFFKNKKIKYNPFESLENSNEEHLEYLMYYFMSLNPNKLNPFIIKSLGYKKDNQVIEDTQKIKLCVGLLEQGYSIHVLEDSDLVKNLSHLSESYEHKLKFFKKGTNPDGFHINF